MEVGICQGSCNNSPAESTSPENGWRWSEGPILGRCGRLRLVRLVAASRRVAAVAWTVRGEGLTGAAVGADLGGSSKYSSENLED